MFFGKYFLLLNHREHGVVGDMRDAWPNARVRKNISLIRTYHGFKGTTVLLLTLLTYHAINSLIVEYCLVISGDKQGALEFLKLIFRALCLCWDRQTQDLHIDWILFRGRSLIPVSCEVVNDNKDGSYPSSHYPLFAEFMLPRTVRMIEPPTQEENWKSKCFGAPMANWPSFYLFISILYCDFYLFRLLVQKHNHFLRLYMIFILQAMLMLLIKIVDVVSFLVILSMHCLLIPKNHIGRKFFIHICEIALSKVFLRCMVFTTFNDFGGFLSTSNIMR